MLYPDQKPVLKVPGSDEDFSVAKYKQELAKPYSKVDLYICKETEFKKDRETDDMSDRRAEKKPCKDDLIDIPSDDDLMFDNPVFESPAKPAIDGNQIPPAASGSSVKQHGRADLYICTCRFVRRKCLQIFIFGANGNPTIRSHSR